jgi:ABC-type glycerol-3-phosphate transport system permease component
MMAPGRSTGRIAGRVAGAMLILALLMPIYWIGAASLMPEAALFEPPSLVPSSATTSHYRALFDERNFLVPVRNSLVVALLTTAITLPLATLCAYALARLRMRGTSWLLALVLSISMFPQISIVPPLYLILREAGLLDTYPGLVLPYLTFSAPLAIWLLTSFFSQLPRELEEAAMIDGASRLRAIRDVIVPLSAPALASTAILTVLYCWNEFLFALSFTLGPDRYTVPVAVALFRGRYQVPWGQVLAAAAVSTLPVALLVLAFQRRLIAGLTAGAVKG